MGGLPLSEQKQKRDDWGRGWRDGQRAGEEMGGEEKGKLGSGYKINNLI